MSKLGLENANVPNPDTFDWVKYFEYNNAHLFKLDFGKNDELTDTEIELISPSIKAFQIGEGSEGKHLIKCVARFAKRSNYTEYNKIMQWFILEENRHSQTLKKYMEIYNIKPIESSLLDNIFRFMRKLTGLECEVIVLVTAEMIALSYYSALSQATNSQLLKTICQQMLNDELKHVVLQSDTLRRISAGRNRFINSSVRLIRKIIMKFTAFIVWHKYKKLFISGNYPYKKFKSDCNTYLMQSIVIEKSRNI